MFESFADVNDFDRSIHHFVFPDCSKVASADLSNMDLVELRSVYKYSASLINFGPKVILGSAKAQYHLKQCLGELELLQFTLTLS